MKCITFVLAWFIFAVQTAAAANVPALPGDYPMKAQQVGKNVYAVISPARDFPNAENKGWNSNSAFVVTPDGVLVFDSGSSEAIGQALKKVIASVTDKPVRWLVNSHGHGDHWLGNAALAGPDVEVIASGTVKTRIDKEGPDWVQRFAGMTQGYTGASRVRVPDTVIDDRISRTFGGVKVEFIPSGNSHSPGDILAWLPEQRILLGGDVLYSDRMPATFDSNIRQWVKFLTEMEQLKPRAIVPGHGEVANVSALKRQREFLSSLWDNVKTGFDKGQSDFEILPTVRSQLAAYRKIYPDFEANIGNSVSHVYLQVEQSSF